MSALLSMAGQSLSQVDRQVFRFRPDPDTYNTILIRGVAGEGSSEIVAAVGFGTKWTLLALLPP